jgi:ubiquinone/menaquinone biosynthesis C-methylase UbiE
MNKKISLYKSIQNYFIVEEMKNETTMWYVAAGLLVQFINSKKNPFGALKEYVGYKKSTKKIEILDVCSGPGTFANYLSSVVPNLKVTCVDLDDQFISYSKKHYKEWKFIKDNALRMNLQKSFDVITISSGYHHIVDKEKVVLLENLRRHLSSKGIIIFCDNFLPKYKNKLERKLAVQNYYRELRKYYEVGNGSLRALNALKDVEKRDLNKGDEYKVSFEIFTKHLCKAKLFIDQHVTVTQLCKDFGAGSNVLILKRRII